MKILVIEALGLHLGFLGCYGNDWVATPNLDRLAAESVVFDWHYADRPELHVVTPFHERSVGTGCYTHEAAPTPPRLPRVVRCESVGTFANEVRQALSANDPWLWIEGPSLLPPWRLASDLLDVYFDEDDEEEGLKPWSDPPLEVVELRDAETLRLQSTFAAAVTFFDAQLGAILDHLDQDTLLVVTARSGLPLGEHGMIGTPQPRLHDELVHLPLLMHHAAQRTEGVRVTALTQPVDLLPTLLEALGQAGPPMHGHSLWPLMRGEVASVRPYAVATLTMGSDTCQLLRSPAAALHVHGDGTRAQLFMKPEDRWEVNDLAGRQIELAESMEKTLRAFGEASRALGPIDYPPLEGDL